MAEIDRQNSTRTSIMKEQELIHGRIALKETKIDSIHKKITLLYIFFFLFHSTTLMLLFNSSFSSSSSSSCHRSWVPSLCSLLFSLGIICAVRYKSDVEVHMEKMLQMEEEDKGLLGKCVEELKKKKGSEFDLLKEVNASHMELVCLLLSQGSSYAVSNWFY